MSHCTTRACRGRAFAPATSLATGATITLDGAESHYLVRVRRVGAGDPVEILDGARTKYAAAVVRADPRACVVTLRALVPAPVVAPWIVLVGIVEPRAMAEALTGASEAGAERVVAVQTSRAHTKFPAAGRMDKVIRAAQRQCGRATPLHLDAPMSLADALSVHPTLPGFVATPGAAPTSTRATAGGRVLIGPEGGLTDEEVRQALDAEFGAVHLGPYIQRTPTAVVSALARLRGR